MFIVLFRQEVKESIEIPETIKLETLGRMSLTLASCIHFQICTLSRNNKLTYFVCFKRVILSH